MNWDCPIASAKRSRQHKAAIEILKQRKPTRDGVVDDLLWRGCWLEVLKGEG